MSNEKHSPVPPEIVAVIAAAIAVVLEKSYRVVSIKKVALPPPHMNVWAFEGRVELSMSHRLR